MAAVSGIVPVSFGFLESAGVDSKPASPGATGRPATGGSGKLPSNSSTWRGGADRPQFVGLGQGQGGQLARSCLVSVGASLLEQARMKRTATDLEGGKAAIAAWSAKRGLALASRPGGSNAKEKVLCDDSFRRGRA